MVQSMVQSRVHSSITTPAQGGQSFDLWQVNPYYIQQVIQRGFPKYVFPSNELHGFPSKLTMVVLCVLALKVKQIPLVQLQLS